MALSALNFSAQPTFSSLNSGKWAKVYTNSTSTGTYFLDDLNSQFKAVKIGTTGTILNSVTGALVGTQVTSTTLTGSTTRTDLIKRSAMGGATTALFTGSTTFSTEKVGSASSQLVGSLVNSMTVTISKTGAPTGTAIIGCFDSTGATLIQFGTQDVSLLSTSLADLTYTTTTAARTLANGDFCGVFFNSGSSGNQVNVDQRNPQVFDGTNSFQATGTGAQGAATMTSVTANDIHFTLSYVYGAGNANLAANSATENFENQGQIVRAIQSDDENTDSLPSAAPSQTQLTQNAGTNADKVIDGTTNIIGEHITATSALLNKRISSATVGLKETTQTVLTQNTGTNTNAVPFYNGGAVVAAGEHINSGAALIGATVNSMSAFFVASSAGDSGTITVCIMTTSNACTYTFGTLSVASITTTPTQFTFTNTAATHVIASGDRIGVNAGGGSVSGLNQLAMEVSTADVYDTTKAAMAQYNGAWLSDVVNDLGASGDAWTLSLVPIGTLSACIFTSGNTCATTLATINISTLTSSYVQTAFTASYPTFGTLTSGSYFGIKYNGDGDLTASAFVSVSGSSADVYDSTNSRLAVYTSSWQADTNTDLGSSTNNWILAYVGSNVAVAEKAAASSALILSSSYDTARLELKKTGSPTGTATICVMDSTGTCVAGGTFGTQDVSLLTTSYATYQYQSVTAISIALNQYIGIQYSSGSVGNTLDVADTATNPFDGTNSVLSKNSDIGTWTDTSTADTRFKLSQEVTGSAVQEAGAFIKADFGSNQNTGGMWVYFQDTTKIPSSVIVSTSTDDITYTPRLTISPAQATGGQYFTLDNTYSVRYVKMTVNTWGTAKSMQIGAYARLPTVGANACALSNIETVSSVNRVYYGCVLSATVLYTGIINIDTGLVISSNTGTMTSTTSTPVGIGVAATKNLVYYVVDCSGSGCSEANKSNRDLTGFATIQNLATAKQDNMKECAVGTFGAAAANDVIYCLSNDISDTSAHIFKVTSSALSVLSTISGGQIASATSQIVEINGLTIARFLQTATTKTYTINPTGDVVTSVYTETWLNFQKQQYDFDGTTATYKTGTGAYLATASHAVTWASNTATLTDPSKLYIQTVNNSTFALTGWSSLFYRVSDSLLVSGSATTWTPQSFSSVQLTPTSDDEKVSSALQQNTTLFTTSVYKPVCTNAYLWPSANQIYVNNDSDCTSWTVLATSAGTIGRTIIYSETSTLVHANPFTAYTFQITNSDPSAYRLQAQYQGTVVDNQVFDAGGTAQLRLLYGNCYEIFVINLNTGASTDMGQACANDITTKTINFGTINVPDNLFGQQWQCSVKRTFGGGTNINTSHGNLTLTVRMTEPDANITTPNYNVSVYYTDYFTSQNRHTPPTHWSNQTNVSGNSTFFFGSGSGSDPVIPDNATRWMYVMNNAGVTKTECVTNGKTPQLTNPLSPLGTIFGIGLPSIFALLVLAVFPKPYAHFGGLAGAATIGIMAWSGLMPDINSGIMSIIILAAAVGLVYGYKKF